MRKQSGFKRLTAACAALLFLSIGSIPLSAAPTPLQAINPNPLTVNCGGNQIGTLAITAYQADNPGANGPGATLTAAFTQTLMPTCNLNLQWLQAIVSGTGTIGQDDVTAYNTANGTALPSPIPYLDPYHRDDNLPYYNTTVENMTVGKGQLTATSQPGTLFSDSPSEGPVPLVNGDNIHFETALVGISPTNPLQLYWLAGFTWGYSIAAGTSTVDAFAYTNAPSAALTNALTQFDGTQNYVGDTNGTKSNNAGGSAGYKFVVGCPTCLPEPGMVFALVAAVGFTVGARGKRAA